MIGHGLREGTELRLAGTQRLLGTLGLADVAVEGSDTVRHRIDAQLQPEIMTCGLIHVAVFQLHRNALSHRLAIGGLDWSANGAWERLPMRPPEELALCSTIKPQSLSIDLDEAEAPGRGQ